MKKKIAALVLAASLVTGMGGFGTYSYFSDSETVKDNINITMGTFDIEANWQKDSQWASVSEYAETISSSIDTLDEKWHGTPGKPDQTPGKPDQTPETPDQTPVSGGLNYTNVKPGDTFERTIVVENKGSLKADTTIRLMNDKYKDKFEITITQIVDEDRIALENGQFNTIMASGDTLEFNISVKLPLGDKNTNTVEDFKNLMLDDANVNFVQVDAVQLGVNK